MIDINKKIVSAWDVVERCLFIFEHRSDVTYCLGCSGEVVGRDKIVENQFRYYYVHGYKSKIDESIATGFVSQNVDDAWQRWSYKYNGKMAFDCSGLIDWCLGYMGNHKYSSWNFGSMRQEAEPLSGFACWKKGHVGLYIGFNNFIHIAGYGRTLEMLRLDEDDWSGYHKIDNLSYEEVTK